MRSRNKFYYKVIVLKFGQSCDNFLIKTRFLAHRSYLAMAQLLAILYKTKRTIERTTMGNIFTVHLFCHIFVRIQPTLQ